MSIPGKLGLILALAAGTAALPSLSAQDRDTDRRDADGVREAIRFEKAKQAAADRQARIEERNERGANSADRMVPEQRRKTKAPRNRPEDRKDAQQQRDTQ
jgi:hypothetical protein